MEFLPTYHLTPINDRIQTLLNYNLLQSVDDILTILAICFCKSNSYEDLSDIIDHECDLLDITDRNFKVQFFHVLLQLPQELEDSFAVVKDIYRTFDSQISITRNNRDWVIRIREYA